MMLVPELFLSLVRIGKFIAGKEMEVSLRVDNQMWVADTIVSFIEDDEPQGSGCVRTSIEGMYAVARESKACGDVGERYEAWSVAVGPGTSDGRPSWS